MISIWILELIKNIGKDGWFGEKETDDLVSERKKPMLLNIFVVKIITLQILQSKLRTTTYSLSYIILLSLYGSKNQNVFLMGTF